MRIREDMDRLEAAEKALGLRDADPDEDLTEKVAEDTEEEAEGDSPNTDELSETDAHPEDDDAPAVEDDSPEPLVDAEDGVQPRKYAGKYETVEDLERAYQESLTLAGRHGQELGTWRQQAEQRQREAEELRQQLQQRQQSEQQASQEAFKQHILTTHYDRLAPEARDYLDRLAEHYGTDPLSVQAQLRITADVQAQYEQVRQQAMAGEQRAYRVNYLGTQLASWIEQHPDRDELGAEVNAEMQRRKHLFNVPDGISLDEELEHYQYVIDGMFTRARVKRQKAEAERQAHLVAEKKKQQGQAFDARRRAAGESANSVAPRAPLPSAPVKDKSPVDDLLDRKTRRTLANLING